MVRNMITWITIIGYKDSQEKQGTILHIERLEESHKFIVYDECLEGIQSDGDGTKELFETYDQALDFARQEAEGYRKTYEGLGWYTIIKEE